MTGLLLTLAGLTCGDGGPGTGAAREAAEVSFEGIWVGAVEAGGGKPLPVRWDNDAGAVWVDGGGGIANFVRSGPEALIVTSLGDAYSGTYSFAGDRLILRFAMKGKTFHYTLRRAREP